MRCPLIKLPRHPHLVRCPLIKFQFQLKVEGWKFNWEIVSIENKFSIEFNFQVLHVCLIGDLRCWCELAFIQIKDKAIYFCSLFGPGSERWMAVFEKVNVAQIPIRWTIPRPRYRSTMACITFDDVSRRTTYLLSIDEAWLSLVVCFGLVVWGAMSTVKRKGENPNRPLLSWKINFSRKRRSILR